MFFVVVVVVVVVGVVVALCVVLTMRKMSVTGTIHSFFFILGDQEITEAATKPKSEGIG